MRSALMLVSVLSIAATGCSSVSSKTQPTIYAAGEKATVGQLIYNVTDAMVTPQLGDDPKSARAAEQRFYLIKVSVSNSGSQDQPIPGMTLVSDDGQMYNEFGDGTGVPDWLGVVRKVGPAETDQGNVLFDAPEKHYRLRLNDPLDEKEIAIDIPLNFVHEMGNIEAPPESPKN